MRVAIFATNDAENVSGGRYHALMLAYAVASLGWEAHFVTDNKPSFFEDLSILAPGGVKLHLSADFVSRLPGQAFDWVIIIPTGVFLPEFYEAGLEFARASQARVGLVNFETGEWFNALAPEPRDPRLWDYWRRVCHEGALVLSSARESNDWARRFYRAPEGRIRFEVWQPPINSVAARRFDEFEKDGSVVAFVRPQDTHKGAGILAQLAPRLFRRRTLHLISGREAPASFKAEMARRLEREEGARLVFHLRVNDQHKFRLLAAAQAVLFPSRFEGYGYPPVEAAFSGTECVVFDLPVLRETVGGVAHFAPTPDLAGFESAMAAALARPPRRAELRQAVFEIGDFHRCALRLADILLRSADSVAPLKPRSFRALLGPFPPTPPSPFKTVDRRAPTPAFPPYVASAVETTGGDLLTTVRAWLPETATTVDVALTSGAPLPAAWRFVGEAAGGFREGRLHILAPREALGRSIVATARPSGGRPASPVELRIDRVLPADAARPALAGVSEDANGTNGRRLRAWALARQPLGEALLSTDGRTWRAASVDRERSDIASKYPAYETTRCEFRTEISPACDLEGGRALLLCVAASLQAVDALVGWPPKPSSYFDDAAKPAEAAPALLMGFGARPRRPQLGEVALAPLSDTDWRHGVALSGAVDRLGAVAVVKDAPPELLKVGAVLRFASGAARRIVAVEPQAGFLLATLDATLSPEAVGRSGKATVHSGDWKPSAEREFTLFPWTDSRWWRGVWNARDRRFRCGFTIKTAQAAALGLKVGTSLRFAATGPRQIREIDDSRGNMRVWLDGPIRPLADTAQAIAILGGDPGEDGIAFVADDPRTVIVAGEEARKIRGGDLLRLAGETLARVLRAHSECDQVRLTLDHAPGGLPAGGTLRLVDEADAPDGYSSPFRRPGLDLKARDPLFHILARESLRRGSALQPTRPSFSAQRRALVVSAVSPCPANQGNRVVTRNLIRHLVALGFQCDVVVQNAVDAAATADEFGAQARFLAVAYPDWRNAEAHSLRQSIVAAAESLRANPLDAETAETIDLAASRHHPYFIVRDETVELARTLYAQHAYEAVVVNYTHMARVAEELEAIRPLPPTAIFTHDALSRLPRAFAGRKLDLAHRLCSAEAEREALNAVSGACVVAISKTEAEYFRAIGVTNRIVVSEYDAEEEMAPFAIPPGAFERRTIIFHGSANPMNIAGLDWFVDECWAQILVEAPEARLIVCGSVGAAWSPQIPGIEVVGEFSRDSMLELCAGASLAINPCVAGTGLKIKTVETAALGLPAVCLPTAVDGLEDIAESFAIVAADANAFIQGCIALLTDRQRWSDLSIGARALAARRFSAAAVYQELDEAMGWRASAPAPPECLAAEEDSLAEISNPAALLEREPDNEAAQFALGKSLARGGRADIGWPMVDQIATARRGDWRAASEAAELGLQTGAPWRAAIFAARMIAQRPTRLRGYLLMGRALMGCNLPHQAAAAFAQGLMIAPFDEQGKRGLIEALARAGRAEEAETWLGRPAMSLRLGQYFALRPAMPGVGARGFENESGDALLLRGGEGSLLLPAPHDDAALLTAALDIERPKVMTADMQLELSFEGLRRIWRLRARGPGVQTISIDASAGAFSSGYARLGLRVLAPATLEAPLRLIGLVIGAREAAERVAVSA